MHGVPADAAFDIRRTQSAVVEIVRYLELKLTFEVARLKWRTVRVLTPMRRMLVGRRRSATGRPEVDS